MNKDNYENSTWMKGESDQRVGGNEWEDGLVAK